MCYWAAYGSVGNGEVNPAEVPLKNYVPQNFLKPQEMSIYALVPHWPRLPQRALTP